MLAIKMENVTKVFGKFKANDSINMKVKKGEIHALLGENGAGKSTLMNILYGLYQIDGGSIYIDGKLVNITSPRVAQDLKIGMVHQHFMLVDTFSVVQNIILGKEETKKGKIYLDDAKEKLKKLISKYNFELDVDTKIKDLSVGQRQRVEILKVLYSGANILIFDEPTAVLTPNEVENFLKILKELQKEGKTIILITHKLAEIKAVANECTVIRKGKSIATVEVGEVSEKELAKMMVGHTVHEIVNEKKQVESSKVLDLSHVKYTNENGVLKLKDLNLEIYSGKILGIAGVDNNGQKELVDVLTGLVKPDSGSVTYFDLKKQEQDLLKKDVRGIRDGIMSCIPEDRLEDGLVLEYDLAQNSVLVEYYKKKFSSGGFLNKKAQEDYGEYICKKYDVRSGQGIKTQAGKLSGGNQQKLIVGREIETNSKIIIAFQPTRGVDVGAINFIHDKLIKQRDQGKAVVLVSMELTEVLSLSDEIAVIHDGQIIDVVDAKSAKREEVGLMMAGKKVQNEK